MAHMERKGIRETPLYRARKQGPRVERPLERNMGRRGILSLRVEVQLRTRKAGASEHRIIRWRGRNQRQNAPLARDSRPKGPEGLKEKRVRKKQRREPVASPAGKEKDRRTGMFKNKKNRRIQGKRGQEEKGRTEEQNSSKKKARKARVPTGRRSCRRKSKEKKGPGGKLRRQQRKKSKKNQRTSKKKEPECSGKKEEGAAKEFLEEAAMAAASAAQKGSKTERQVTALDESGAQKGTNSFAVKGAPPGP